MQHFMSSSQERQTWQLWFEIAVYHMARTALVWLDGCRWVNCPSWVTDILGERGERREQMALRRGYGAARRPGHRSG